MPAAELVRLEKELGALGAESISINVSRGTLLHSEIRRMLSRRSMVSDIKKPAEPLGSAGL